MNAGADVPASSICIFCANASWPARPINQCRFFLPDLVLPRSVVPKTHTTVQPVTIRFVKESAGRCI